MWRARLLRMTPREVISDIQRIGIPAAGLGLERLDPAQKAFPGSDLIHLSKEAFVVVKCSRRWR